MLYIPTDISPEQVFQAIGRLRKEARDEIDRLVRFLDKTENHMEREPGDEGDLEEDDHGEDDGLREGHDNQLVSWQCARTRRRRIRH